MVDLIKNIVLSKIAIAKVLIKSSFFTKLPIPDLGYEKCYILGNGPSLNLSLAKSKDKLLDPKNAVMAVNAFITTDIAKEIKPKYYIFLDSYFGNYDDSKENYSIKSVYQTYKNLEENVDWEMNLLIPYSFHKNQYFKKLQSINKNIKVTYFNYVVANGLDSVRYILYNNQLASPQCQNVLAIAIFTAINMNFKDIIIWGADHSWHEQVSIGQNGEVIVNDTHFFNPNGVSVSLNSRTLEEEYGIHSFFASLSKAFYAYKVIAKYAKYKKVNIVNESEKSYIDAFKRN